MRNKIKTNTIKNTKNKVFTYDPNISAKYYSMREWKLLRSRYILENPLCEECAKQNIITPATEVHHKIEFLSVANEKLRMELFLDYDNLQALCNKCHHKKHKPHKSWNKIY